MPGNLTHNGYPFPENFDRSLVWTNEIREERWNGGTVPDDPVEKNQWLTSFICINCIKINHPDLWSLDKRACDECVKKILAEDEKYWNNGISPPGGDDEDNRIWVKRWKCLKCLQCKNTSKFRWDKGAEGYKMCDECYAEWEEKPVEVIGKNGY